MTEAVPSLPASLAFTYREGELAAYSELVADRIEPDPSGTFWEVVFAAVPALGLIVLLTNHLGWITAAQMPPVLVTTYVAFFAGALALYGMWALRSRQAARIVARSASVQGEWEVRFEEGGVSWKSPKTEARVPWDAVEAVAEARSLVTIWIDRDYGIPIPARLFADAAARNAFIAAIRARVTAKAASV